MARIKATFRAGDLVTVRDDAFKVNWDDTVEDVAYANYHVTREDTERWYADKRRATEEAKAKGEDTFSINFDSAGESVLPRAAAAPLCIVVRHTGSFGLAAERASVITTLLAVGRSCWT